MAKSNSIAVSKKNKHRGKEFDVFKDTPIRYIGYANEVGEAFRVVVPVHLVRLSYVVASTYVFCDAVHKGHRAWKRQPEDSSKKNQSLIYKKSGIAFTDTLIWQGFASVAVPGFTINRICWFTRLCLGRIPRLPQPVRYWGVVVAGLASIPFIIKPIDQAVDLAMDKTIRKCYFDESDM